MLKAKVILIIVPLAAAMAAVFASNSTQFIYVPDANAADPNTTLCTSRTFGYTTNCFPKTTTIWATTNPLQPCIELQICNGLSFSD